jgi:asparagine synthetase A
MVVVLIRSNHIGGVKVSVHAASVVDSGLLIQLPSTPTIYNTRGVYTNLYTTDVVTSNKTTINTHYLHSTRGVYTNLYTTDVVTSNKYNYHQHPLSTTLAATTPVVYRLVYTPRVL